MSKKTVSIFGGTGYLGSVLTAVLAKNGYRVQVFSRDRNVQNSASCLAYVEYINECPLEDEAKIRKHLKGSDYIINMVGTWDTKKRRVRKAHVEYPKRLYEIADEFGVKKMIHFSALGATEESSSRYLATKAEGEKAVIDRARSGRMKLAVVRPSLIVGHEDPFSYHVARFMRLMPVMMLPMANAELQPVFIDDVTEAVLRLLENDYDQTIFELAGPERYTLKELAGKIAKAVRGTDKGVKSFPTGLASLIALFWGWVPGFPYSRNQIKAAKTPSVSEKNDFAVLGIKPANYDSFVAYEMPTKILDKYYDDRLMARR